jgi:hypothetical protein
MDPEPEKFDRLGLGLNEQGFAAQLLFAVEPD